ncbi:MAG TPA: hypothetical protein VHD87_11525 [Acidimicrobiales bacterium]|nr:hypothetical protein [Acidimicrobiales bacterium]
MPYAFTLDAPVPPAIYKQVNDKARAQLGGAKPAGLLSHVVYEVDGHLRHVDVWESRADWEAFEAILSPIIAEAASSVGRSPEGAVFTEIELVDAWL